MIAALVLYFFYFIQFVLSMIIVVANRAALGTPKIFKLK